MLLYIHSNRFTVRWKLFRFRVYTWQSYSLVSRTRKKMLLYIHSNRFTVRWKPFRLRVYLAHIFPSIEAVDLFEDEKEGAGTLCPHPNPRVRGQDQLLCSQHLPTWFTGSTSCKYCIFMFSCFITFCNSSQLRIKKNFRNVLTQKGHFGTQSYVNSCLANKDICARFVRQKRGKWYLL
jgi:hypothetical protein